MPEQQRLDQLLRRVAALQRQFDQIRITGGRDVIVEGEPRRGFKIDILDDGEGGEGGPSGGGGLRGCTNPLATNYNPFATVDDGSCVFPAGDCPPDITLTCDSVSASKSKCGLRQEGDNAFYLRKEVGETSAGSYARGQHCDATGHDFAWMMTYNYFNGDVTTVSLPDCSESTTNTCFGELCGTPSEDCDDFGGCGSGTNCDSICGNIFTTLGGECQVRQIGGGCWFGFTIDCPAVTTTYSDEYTTDMLKSNTIADLPPYDGSFGSGGCSASSNLATDESSYAITRFRYLFVFSPVGNDFILSWNEHTEFDGGGSSNSGRSIFVSAGSTETIIFECLEPSSNGVTTITDIVCTPHS